MKIATLPLKKVTPLFLTNLPLKIKVLSRPPFSKFGTRFTVPAEKGEDAHYEGGDAHYGCSAGLRDPTSLKGFR